MQELLHPGDTLERQRDKLLNICASLMRRVEQAPSDASNAYAQFERAAILDAKVRERTAELERALDLLNASNAQLAEANREIETAQSNLNAAIESVDEGFALFDADERLVLFNSRFCCDLDDVMAGLAPGMPFVEFVRRVSQSAALDLPEGVSSEAWAARRMERHAEASVVFNIALTDDRWMQVSEHRTEDGGTAIIQTDITGVMRAQHKERALLVDSQARMLRATLDHLEQGVCIFDEQNCLVGWNLKIEQMIRLTLPGGIRMGLRFSRILELLDGRMTFSEGRDRAWLQSWAETPAGRLPITFNLTANTGQIYSVFAQEMPDAGFVISFTDVTSAHRAANELRDLNRTLEQRVEQRTEELGLALGEAERANESKTRFVAAASHDLLQPLSAAKLYLATLQDMGEDGLAKDISGKALKALGSAEDIIEALLDISRLDAGHTTFDVQPFSLGQTFDSIATEMAPLAAAKGLRLDVVPTSLTIVSDPVFFRRILQNLVSNAIRYTDTGRILVGVRRRKDGRACVEVHDTGRGIRPEDQQRIFQEFAQLDRNHGGSEGLGLGLAIVERACASLGHGLRLRSTFGQGSCFSVGVAEHLGAVASRAPAPNGADALDALRGLILLLVENDPNLAQAITFQFEGRGAHVLHCASGEAALALLSEIELVPDAMLLDYQLGAGMSGLELYSQIRGTFGAVPGMIISADRSKALEAECARIGAPLLRKPFDAAQFSAALAEVTTPLG